MVTYKTDLAGVDWEALVRELVEDRFHNGRTAAQLRRSFENSAATVLGYAKDRCLATGRMLSDGVGNAYIVDLWVHSPYRGRGIGSAVMRRLLSAAPGQHVYLQADNAELFTKLGFRPQPHGMGLVVGAYLRNASRVD